LFLYTEKSTERLLIIYYLRNLKIVALPKKGSMVIL
jgi:hypothetical protein